MKRNLSVRDLWLIKLRATKNLNPITSSYQDVITAADCALQLLKENLLLKEKLFDIEQSVSEDERILNIIDAKLNMALLSNDKKDFLEINRSINNEVWTIIIQKKFGQTPQQCLKQYKIRLSKAAKKIINLHRENSTLNKSIDFLKKEVKVLNASKTDDPIKALQDREDLLRLRDIVESKIKIHNASVYRHGIATLHKSFSDSLREAWARASFSDIRAGEAEKKLSELEKQSRKKKSLLSLIYNRKKVKINY